jgi:oxygen-independent coproporphyrinogen-3 oxidase
MTKIDWPQRLEIFKDITYRYNLIFPSDYLFISPSKILGIKEMLVHWLNFLQQKNNPLVFLYFHMPFCYKQRCAYCHNDTTVLRQAGDLELYLDYLQKMMIVHSYLFRKVKFKTMYVGGGTPSILSAKQIDSFLKNINKYFKFASDGMRTFEMSPITASREKIDICKANGISRLSMGVQTLNCNILKSITRVGNLALNDLRQLFDYVNKKKFDDFNIDLIIGLPDETQSSFLSSFKEIVKMDVPSITIYKYIHDSQEEKDKNNLQYYQKTHLTDFPEIHSQLETIVKDFGYIEETKNSKIMNLYRYVKKDHSPKFDYFPQWNANYNNSLLGIGRGAESFIEDKIFAIEKFDLQSDLLKPAFTQYVGYLFTKDDQIRNYVVLELWRFNKIDKKIFARTFSENFTEYFAEEIAYLKSLNKIDEDNNYVKLKIDDSIDFAIWAKFFFNFSYLEKNYLKR